MGGIGSTRWRLHSKKVTKEECYVLDVTQLRKLGAFDDPTFRADEVRWKDGWSVDFEVHDAAGTAPMLRLIYSVEQTGDCMDYTLPLETTRPSKGGTRYYLTCPMDRGGGVCCNRVLKLFLRPGESMFACARCCAGGLSYESRNDRTAGKLATAQKIRVALGGSANVFEPFPLRPRHMWGNTYERLRQRAAAAEAAYNLKFENWMKRLDRMVETRRRQIGEGS